MSTNNLENRRLETHHGCTISGHEIIVKRKNQKFHFGFIISIFKIKASISVLHKCIFHEYFS